LFVSADYPYSYLVLHTTSGRTSMTSDLRRAKTQRENAARARVRATIV